MHYINFWLKLSFLACSRFHFLLPGTLSFGSSRQATWSTISREQMGEVFFIYSTYKLRFKFHLQNDSLVNNFLWLIHTFRALTESLDKCRRRYQVRIRRLEQQCAGQGRAGGQGVHQGVHQAGAQGVPLPNNNTDTAESRSTRTSSSRTEEALWGFSDIAASFAAVRQQPNITDVEELFWVSFLLSPSTWFSSPT